MSAPISRPLWIVLVIVTLLTHEGVAEITIDRSVQSGIMGAGMPWATPYYIVDSGVDGPTVFITGGIHGNEPSGARSAEQIRHWPIIRGKMIVVPRVNTAALDSNLRRTPDAPAELGDVNRNFPSPDIADRPRGEIAPALWKLVVDQQPDWVFDLHEGFQFNISHKPKPGKDKSVGSSIVFDSKQDVGPLVKRMVAAANSSVTDPDRRFVPLGRGPKKTTLAAAAIDVLGAKAMILETTYQYQRLPVRNRQHRAMMNTALTQLGMLTTNCADVMTPPADERDGQIFVALYDDEGGSERGVANLTRVFDTASNITVAHLSASEIRPEVSSIC